MISESELESSNDIATESARDRAGSCAVITPYNPNDSSYIDWWRRVTGQGQQDVQPAASLVREQGRVYIVDQNGKAVAFDSRPHMVPRFRRTKDGHLGGVE